MDESDGQLLAATARGDADAFGRFYRRHEQQILSYAIAHCANASDVSDVVGETFLGALRTPPIRSPARTRRYLMLSLDDRPLPPELPRFSRNMEEFLVASARRPPRTNQRVRYAVVGVATAAAAAAAAAGISYGTASGPSSGASAGAQTHLAAFSVVANADGTVTLELNRGQLFNPATLRQALAKAGVPALVTVGSVCTAPFASDALNQVISHAPGHSGGPSVTVITPSAIPSGQELSIGYFANGNGLHISLVPDNAHLTCTSKPPFTGGR